MLTPLTIAAWLSGSSEGEEDFPQPAASRTMAKPTAGTRRRTEQPLVRDFSDGPQDSHASLSMPWFPPAPTTEGPCSHGFVDRGAGQPTTRRTGALVTTRSPPRT